MKKAITDEKNMERLSEEEKIDYQRLKGIEDLAKALGKEVPEDVKEKLEQYEKKIGTDELVGLTDEKGSEISTALQQDKDYNEKENLIGNTDAILNDLKENHVKIEENVKYMGYKGKNVHIDLPAVGNFKGFKFNYFVSDSYIKKTDFEEKPELEKKSYPMSDILNLLQAMNKFMIELQGKNDGDMDYENKLKTWEANNIMKCNAGDCLKEITGLDYWYWLSDKDKDIEGGKYSYIRWGCYSYSCFFNRGEIDESIANLLLRLSD